MAEWQDFNSPDAEDYLRKVAARPPINIPEAQTLARSSNNADAQRAGQQMLDQQRENEYRDSTFAAREQRRQADQQERETKRQQAEQLKQQNETEARRVRAAAAAGAQIETDIDTGKRSVALHDDGAPKFKPGPVGVPVEQPVINDALGTVPGIGDVVSSGALGRPTNYTGTEMVQTYRNDRGGEVARPLATKTDPKTAEIYNQIDDPVTGIPQRKVVGEDPLLKVKLEKQNQIAANLQTLDLQQNHFRQAKGTFDPRWQPVQAEYKDAEAEVKRLADPAVRYERAGKAWVKVDADTGAKTLAADEEVRRYQQKWSTANARLARAKAAHDPLAPQAENFTRAGRDLEQKRLQLAEAKLRVDMDLPDDDGGVAGILARNQGLTDQIPHADAVAAVTGGAELQERPDKTAAATVATTEGGAAGGGAGAAFAGGARPMITPESDAASIKNAFGTLKGVEGLEIEPYGPFQAINKGGKWIGSIEKSDGVPVVVLRDDARDFEDVTNTVALGETKGVPLYLRDSENRKKLTDEATDVANVFATLKDPTLFDEAGAPTPALSQRLNELGATPDAIKVRVDRGELSVQHGEALLKGIYGPTETLKPTDPKDPSQFNKWISETSALERKAGVKPGETTADRWAKAKEQKKSDLIPGGAFFSTYSLSAQNDIKKDFAVAWYQENRGKPGVTRAKLHEMLGEDAADSATIGRRINSIATKVGETAKYDAGASMAGMFGGGIRDIGHAAVSLIGKALAATGLDDGKAGEAAQKKLMEDMGLRNRDFANFKNASSRNFKKWGTPEGMVLASKADTAFSAFKRTIDEQEDAGNPDKAAVDAAEMRYRQSMKALHDLSPDEKWPVTFDALDPNKDAALGGLLARYKATGDPRMMELYRERMIADNGRRQATVELEKRTRGLGRAGQSFVGGMNVGWQELGAEMAADASMVVTGGGSKLVQMGLRGAGAVGKAERIALIGTRIGEALDKAAEFGMRAGTLAKPLTRAELVSNAIVKGGKALVHGAVGEGIRAPIVMNPAQPRPASPSTKMTPIPASIWWRASFVATRSAKETRNDCTSFSRRA